MPLNGYTNKLGRFMLACFGLLEINLQNYKLTAVSLAFVGAIKKRRAQLYLTITGKVKNIHSRNGAK